MTGPPVLQWRVDDDPQKNSRMLLCEIGTSFFGCRMEFSDVDVDD